jgi:hypothetical protein
MTPTKKNRTRSAEPIRSVPPKGEAAAKSVAKRWTPALVADGWTPVSDFFLENYHRLRPELSTSEAMFVIHLLHFKWDERHPYPAFKTLAKHMGMSTTAVRNHARSLQNSKHYLTRIMRTAQPNEFDLAKLFAALEKLRTEGQTAAAARARKAAT